MKSQTAKPREFVCPTFLSEAVDHCSMCCNDKSGRSLDVWPGLVRNQHDR